MANLALRNVLEAGYLSNPAACETGGDSFINSGIEFLAIKNGNSGTTYSVTITAQTLSFTHPSFGSVTKASVVKTIAPSQTVYFGPFKQRAFNDSDRKVQLTYLTSGGAAISTINGGDHGLKIEVLFLDQN